MIYRDFLLSEPSGRPSQQPSATILQPKSVRLDVRSRYMLDTVAPVGAWQLRDAAPVPGRQWLRYLRDTL